MGAPGGGDEPVASGVAGSPTRVFELLASDGGRRLLTTLYDRGGTVPVEELAAQLASCDRPALDDEPAPRHAGKRLRHAILPTLSDTGLVTYDRATDAVTLADRGERLEPYLACVRTAEPGNWIEFDDATAELDPTESDAPR